ncbi:hypothetical protein [Streptomyces sp. NPDC000405]|uniref:hypothetical protein n=1 Tax=Streptomyces sp. NPDC000405 TaxID=3161033 RepID=UPI00398D2677
MADGIAVVGGIDTHTDRHQAAVIDSIGRHLATEQFETTRPFPRSESPRPPYHHALTMA